MQNIKLRRKRTIEQIKMIRDGKKTEEELDYESPILDPRAEYNELDTQSKINLGRAGALNSAPAALFELVDKKGGKIAANIHLIEAIEFFGDFLADALLTGETSDAIYREFRRACKMPLWIFGDRQLEDSGEMQDSVDSLFDLLPEEKETEADA